MTTKAVRIAEKLVGPGQPCFVTAEIGDSVKDLKEDLGDKDVLQLTDDAKSADIVVLIQGRGNVETGRRASELLTRRDSSARVRQGAPA